MRRKRRNNLPALTWQGGLSSPLSGEARCTAPMATPHSVLKRYWGFDTFREGQEGVVDAVLAKQDCLVVFATGSGKSLWYVIVRVRTLLVRASDALEPRSSDTSTQATNSHRLSVENLRSSSRPL